MNAKHRTVLKESLKGRGFCKDLGVGPRMYHSLTDNSRGGFDPLEKIITLMDHSQNNIVLDYLCSINGGVFVKNVEAPDSQLTIQQDQSAIICEMADVIKVLTDSCSDGDISTKEVEHLTKEFDELAKVFYGFIQSAEKGRRG